MDRESLPAGSIEAGEAFDKALIALGLRADGLLWAWDHTIGHFVLVLVTEHFDHAGPLAIQRTLFAAYDASATPKEISPFVVRLHSPKQTVVGAMMMGQLLTEDEVPIPDAEFRANTADLTYNSAWVYRWPGYNGAKSGWTRREPTARNREWRRFASNVDRLAA
jgi:hypothetical protein